jgi:hypothetical protein
MRALIAAQVPSGLVAGLSLGPKSLDAEVAAFVRDKGDGQVKGTTSSMGRIASGASEE